MIVGLAAGVIGWAHTVGPAVARSECVGGRIRRALTETERVEPFARVRTSGGEEVNLPIKTIAPCLHRLDGGRCLGWKRALALTTLALVLTLSGWDYFRARRGVSGIGGSVRQIAGHRSGRWAVW